MDDSLLNGRFGGTVSMVCWERPTAIGTAWVRGLIIIGRGVGLFSMVPLAADAASRSAGAGTGVMVVPALCALFYTGSEGLSLNLHIFTIEVNPFGDYVSLVLWDSHDKGARGRVLVRSVEFQRGEACLELKFLQGHGFSYGYLSPIVASILLGRVWEGEYGPILFNFCLGSLDETF